MKQDKRAMSEWAPERKEQDYYSYQASYVIVGTSIVCDLCQRPCSGKAPDSSNRVYFVASGLGVGQEECYRHLWYSVTYTYLFHF